MEDAYIKEPEQPSLLDEVFNFLLNWQNPVDKDVNNYLITGNMPAISEEDLPIEEVSNPITFFTPVEDADQIIKGIHDKDVLTAALGLLSLAVPGTIKIPKGVKPIAHTGKYGEFVKEKTQSLFGKKVKDKGKKSSAAVVVELTKGK